MAVPGILLLAGCAGTQRNAQSSPVLLAEQSPGMFVGHSQHGDVVVTSSHYDAMNGLAVASADLGLSARGGRSSELMMCRREMPTGSHVHFWICRYAEDIERDRTLLQNELAAPRLSPSRSGVVPVAASGGGGRMQSN
jgi:hypothetical protein